MTSEKSSPTSSSNLAKRKERVEKLLQLEPGSKVHVAGVCGTGTSAVALLLKKHGFFVSGSDKAFYPPMDQIVRKNCDVLYEQFSADNITSDLDYVVIGNALGATNPEVERVMELGLPYCSMPDVFEALLIGSREHCPNSIVVAGTHGKTTTTALTAWLFESAGRKPGYFLGGIPENFQSHIRPVSEEIEQQKRVVVLEGDEYDSAYFAKWPKFHSYRPDILLVTSLEFDHADIYQSVDDIRAEFLQVIKEMPAQAIALFWSGSSELKKLQSEIKALKLPQRIFWYGSDADADFKLISRKASTENFSQTVTVNLRDKELTFELKISGEHNALNALATAAIGHLLGLSIAEMQKGLESFSGVKRRQQLLFKSERLIVLEDFAHHPTAVKTTLNGLKEQYPDKRLLAVFEPRSNTSKRDHFQSSYTASFEAADVVMIQEVADQKVYSAFGEEFSPLKVDKIVAEISATGKEAYLGKDADAIFTKLTATIQDGDVVVLMSNGAFGGLPAKLKSWAEKQ